MAIDLQGLCPLLSVFDMPESVHFYRDLLSQARRERARSRVCARCTRSSPIAGKISCTNFLAGSLRSTAQSS